MTRCLTFLLRHWLLLLATGVMALCCSCSVTNIFRPGSRQPAPKADAGVTTVSFKTQGEAIAPPLFRMVTNDFGVVSYSPQTVSLELGHGTNSGNYFEIFMVPADHLFTIVHIHWRGLRDWFAVRSVDKDGKRSPWSAEAWIPLLEPTMVIVTGTNLLSPLELSESLDLTNWSSFLITTNPYIANIKGPSKFYRSRNQLLVIHGFNPMNP